ncbi:MAG TPA: ABC transporter substrate-binding protein [Gammaproteobacteria bacterium]
MGLTGRRQFVLATSALLTAALARAQTAGKVHRVTFLGVVPPQTFQHLVTALTEGLRALGYVEGRNLVLEWRHAEGKMERFPGLASEVVRDKPDVIVTGTNPGTHAAKRATQTIPIVMIVGTDVVGEGFVTSLGRPGGNITGLTWDVGVSTMAKRFDFLKEALPGLSRVAVLWDAGADAPAFESAIKEGAASVGLKLIWLKVTDDLEPLFAEARRAGAEAIFTGGGARLFRLRKEVVALAARYRLPDSHYSGEFVEAGGLMSYAPNLPDMFRRAATHIDKILRGAKPAELPVEQPTRIDLLINLKTAKALGLALPNRLLLRADRVIE